MANESQGEKPRAAAELAHALHVAARELRRWDEHIEKDFRHEAALVLESPEVLAALRELRQILVAPGRRRGLGSKKQ